MRDIPSKKPLTRRDTVNTNKCQFCNKLLPNERALKNHLQSVHSRALRTSNTRNATPVLPKGKAVAKTPQTSVKQDKSVGKVDTTEEADQNISAEENVEEKAELEVTTEDDKESEDEETAMPTDSIKTVFKCPKCIRIFNVCFLAVKHIQNTHCVNAKGEKVDPSSKDIIQPISIEKCTRCDLIIAPASTHHCSYVYYECLVCDVVVTGLVSLYGHIEKHHAEGVESLHFPLRADFQRWKDEVEIQTNCKYLTETHDSKTIHRCKHTKPNTNNNMHKMKFCPSIIVEQNFDSATFVKYYWIHGHPALPYKLTEKFEMFSITSLLRNSENYKSISKTEKPLLLQLKTIVEAVLVDARKTDDRKMKCLLKKALEMTTILKSDGRNAITYRSEKKLSDADISNALSAGDKRKSSEVLGAVMSKRTRSKTASFDAQKNGKSPIILNSLLSTDSKVANVLKEWDSEDDKSNKNSDDDIGSIRLHKEKGIANTYTRAALDSMSPSSFNDSYKDFVDKTFNVRPPSKKKKNVVKTKIGQFKPSLSPKSPNLSPKSPNLPPKSPNLPPKSLNLPPKSPKLVKSPRVESRKSKVDHIEYEIQEQENDCNILILKI